MEDSPPLPPTMKPQEWKLSTSSTYLLRTAMVVPGTSVLVMDLKLAVVLCVLLGEFVIIWLRSYNRSQRTLICFSAGNVSAGSPGIDRLEAAATGVHVPDSMSDRLSRLVSRAAKLMEGNEREQEGVVAAKGESVRLVSARSQLTPCLAVCVHL